MSKRSIHALVIVLSLLVCCAATSGNCGNGNQPLSFPGPSTGEVVGVAVGVGAAATTAVVLVSVHHAHHNLKGCVFESPSGLQLRTEDMKDYSLTGSTNNLAVGNRVHLQGDRQKHDKGAEQIFLVKELKKSYGPCSALATSSPATSAPQNAAPPNPTPGQAHP